MMAKVKKQPLTKEELLAQALVPEDEQPYPVPDNWVWVRLPMVCEYIRAGGDKPKTFSEIRTVVNTIPVVANGVNNDGIIGFTDIENEKKDTITVSGRGTIGFSVLRDYPYYPIVRLIVVAPNKIISPFFLKLTFDNFLEKGVGSSIPQLTVPMLKAKMIPLPPLPEQQRIVERIESLFEKLDRAKELVQNTLDSFETRKAAILHKAFTGELTTNWRKENSVSMDSWENKTLNDVAEYKKGPFGSSITKAMFVPKGQNTYKVYEQGNAIRKTIDYGNYYISKSKFNELKGFEVVPSDIIISCAGTIGEVYKLPENCESGVINQALMRVRIKDCIAETFFILYFGEILKSDIVNKAKGTAILNIPPFSVMKTMPISLPTLSEQQEIVRILDNLFQKEQHAKELCDIIDKIDLVKKAILARAFRGELGTNNPTEKTALELLGGGG
ncbi:MAG: restriction endonuclease subunit S [Spirochaetes bacterium]|nr:restriction endonuclease subunit S [Spirochaetota bacterium]